MKRPSRPVFLARQGYRSHRMVDMSRLLPLLGLFLFVLPLLRQGQGGLSTAGQGLYLFTVWLILIVLAFILARRLSNSSESEFADEPEEDDG